MLLLALGGIGLLALGWRLARLLGLLRQGSALLRWGVALLWWRAALLWWGAVLLGWGAALLWWGAAQLGWGAALLRWGAALLGWGAALLHWGAAQLWGSTLLLLLLRHSGPDVHWKQKDTEVRKAGALEGLFLGEPPALFTPTPL